MSQKSHILNHAIYIIIIMYIYIYPIMAQFTHHRSHDVCPSFQYSIAYNAKCILKSLAESFLQSTNLRFHFYCACVIHAACIYRHDYIVATVCIHFHHPRSHHIATVTKVSSNLFMTGVKYDHMAIVTRTN